MAEKNYFAEKLVATLRKRDTHAHRHVAFITIHESAIRELCEKEEWLKAIADEKNDSIEKEYKKAEANKAKAEAAAAAAAAARKAKNEAIKKKVQEQALKRQKENEEKRARKIAESKAASASATVAQATLKHIEN